MLDTDIDDDIIPRFTRKFKVSRKKRIAKKYDKERKHMDRKYNDGLNYVKNSIKKIKVIEVNAILKNNDGSFGNIKKYWFSSDKKKLTNVDKLKNEIIYMEQNSDNVEKLITYFQNKLL